MLGLEVVLRGALVGGGELGGDLASPDDGSVWDLCLGLIRMLLSITIFSDLIRGAGLKVSFKALDGDGLKVFVFGLLPEGRKSRALRLTPTLSTFCPFSSSDNASRIFSP